MASQCHELFQGMYMLLRCQIGDWRLVIASNAVKEQVPHRFVEQMKTS